MNKISNISKNILDFYENNENNNFYLLKNFTNTDQFGPFEPFQENPFGMSLRNKMSKVKTLDDYNDYYINEFGMRGKFNPESEIIGAGCSFTFGVGVPEEGRWTDILGEKTNQKINNFGLPGYSIEGICNILISYATNYKMPKKIFCVFPDLFRSLMIEDFEFYSSKKWVRDRHENYRLNLTSANPAIYFNYDEKKMYGEIPDLKERHVESLLSPHQLILNSINAIYILESFCSTNNIELCWTTWDPASAFLIDKLLEVPNFKLKKYKKFITESGKNYLNGNASFDTSLCNSDHGSNLNSNHCWTIGSDYVIINDEERPNWASHPGIHFQFHLADFFVNL
jgi:hypothetical protein